VRGSMSDLWVSYERSSIVRDQEYHREIMDENQLVACPVIARKLHLDKEVRYEDAFLDISR
jgi:hypothetical protein